MMIKKRTQKPISQSIKCRIYCMLPCVLQKRRYLQLCNNASRPLDLRVSTLAEANFVALRMKPVFCMHKLNYRYFEQ